jgi:hypothetical protein
MKIVEENKMKATYKGIEFELETEADVNALINTAICNEETKTADEFVKQEFGTQPEKKQKHNNKIKMYNRTPWSKKDETFLLENMKMGEMSIKKISKILGRTPLACQVRYGRLTNKAVVTYHKKHKAKRATRKMNRYHKKWTKSEEQYLLMNKGLKSNRKLAKELGRPTKGVWIKMKRLTDNRYMKQLPT